jgi:hypothetical protein
MDDKQKSLPPHIASASAPLQNPFHWQKVADGDPAPKEPRRRPVLSPEQRTAFILADRWGNHYSRPGRR